MPELSVCYSVYINVFLLSTVSIAAGKEGEENSIGLSVQCHIQKHFYKLPQQLNEKGAGKYCRV